MPKYMVSRTLGSTSEQEIVAPCLSAMDVLDQMPGPRWVRSYYPDAEGKIYREYDSPSAELIFEHAQRARVSIDKAEVVRELEPSMFRQAG